LPWRRMLMHVTDRQAQRKRSGDAMNEYTALKEHLDAAAECPYPPSMMVCCVLLCVFIFRD
jgi:hypothetical protein